MEILASTNKRMIYVRIYIKLRQYFIADPIFHYTYMLCTTKNLHGIRIYFTGL